MARINREAEEGKKELADLRRRECGLVAEVKYRKAFNASAAGAAQDRQKAAKALTEIETKITSILKAIEDGMYHASMKAKMTELEAEQSRLQSVLAQSPLPCGCIPACRPGTAS